MSTVLSIPEDAFADAPVQIPLVVDLDGTLTPTDTLVESIVLMGRQVPGALWRLPSWLVQGRAVFKDRIASRVSLPVKDLPFREEVVTYLRVEKARGRKIVLATAAHHTIAEGVADHLGLFDQVIASDANRNLKGKKKLEAIHQGIGQPFAYAGDSAADLPIWSAAEAAVLVNTSHGVSNRVRSTTGIEQEFIDRAGQPAAWMKALRIHQWLKNVLLFVALLTSFEINWHNLLALSVAFIAFSLAASATYVLNDLWDLQDDRAHPRKCKRPFASATLPLLHGIAMSLALFGASYATAWLVGPAFMCMLTLYILSTTCYSWVLKRYVLLDVLALAVLYTLRIITGCVVIGVVPSSWLLAFSVFLFLSLALVKRCSELARMKAAGTTAVRGRDYQVTDLVVLFPMGVSTSIASIVVFGLFISVSDTALRYATPMLLWMVALIMVYWLARIWIKTARLEMDDDPVLYTLKDRGSKILLAVMAGIVLAAHYFSVVLPQ
jgi:4-hydroxybenzoate polyprenyltransferase/phosphoserine phosphatase